MQIIPHLIEDVTRLTLLQARSERYVWNECVSEDSRVKVQVLQDEVYVKLRSYWTTVQSHGILKERLVEIHERLLAQKYGNGQFYFNNLNEDEQ